MEIEIEDKGANNSISIHDTVRKTGNMRIVFEGSNNSLIVGSGTTLGSGIIELGNNHSKIDIGEDCLINGQLRCRDNETFIKIGSMTTMMSVQISLHERGSIEIGSDCMFSGQIQMDVSDMHSIIDVSSAKRINPPKNITIKDHVWIGHGVHILKGNTIGHDSIIGAKALVATSIPNNVIAVGIPAKVVKSGITWDRRRIPFDDNL